MDKLIDLLAKVPPYIVIIYLGVFFTLEHFWPLAKDRKNRISHLLNNAGLLVIATAANFFISFILVYWVAFIERYNFGLMNVLNFSKSANAITGVIVLDFTSYFIHRGIHKIRFLWRFHRVHHSEIDLDSSTAFKFHPLEAIIVFPALLVEIGLMGIGFPAIVLYNVIILPVFFILHSNLNYPKWLEKSLIPLFATPDFHRVHHSDEQKYTDSNYGDIFSIWDRLFGTFKKANSPELNYGLKEFSEKKTQSFWYMISSPFRR